MTKNKKEKPIKVSGASYSQIEFEKELCTHDNSLQSCSVCGWKIPADMQRLSYEWSGFQRSGSYRVCAICLMQIMKQLKGKQKAKKLMEKRMEAYAIEQL